MIKILVKEVAESKGFSMRQLSKRSGITYRTIQYLYNKPGYMPTLPTLLAIARTLGVSIADLIIEEE